MIVPNEIAPVDYNKNTNEFIFVLEDFILRVNYETKQFELETPDNLAYNEDFEFIKSPPVDFEIIDFGLVEWIRLALKWNISIPKKRSIAKPFSFQVEGITYTGEFNPRTNDLTLSIPGRTIICYYDTLTTEFPEIQFMDYGQLVTMISSIAVSERLKCYKVPCEETDFVSPTVFTPESITVEGNEYEFGMITSGLALLRIPNRNIYTNMLTITTDVPELTVLHQEMLIDVIRDVVYEKTTT